MERVALAHGQCRQRQRWQRERGATKALFDTIKPEPLINLPLDTIKVTHANGSETVAQGQAEVAEACTSHWKALFNQRTHRRWSQDTDAFEAMLARVRADAKHVLSAEQAAALTPEAMFTEENIAAAIGAIKKDTSPGASGITTGFIAHDKWREQMAAHLARLALRCASQGMMTPAMRTSIISILYKGGEKPRDRCTSHRPVSLTDAAYRIIDKVVEMQMNKVISTLLDGSNVGFVPGARCETDTLTMAEAARYAHNGAKRGDGPTGGVVSCLDADKAYDRVEIETVLLPTLRAFGFPESFVALIGTFYTDLHAQLKVNGHLGTYFSIGNGLRQGAPTSCPLFLLVQEVFIRDLKADTSFEGMAIPGPGGVGKEELRVRAYADDTKLFLRSLHDARALQDAIARWEDASGQIISADKLTIILLGDQIGTPVPSGLRYKRLVRYGKDEADKSIGIQVGTTQQVNRQWLRMLADVETMALDATAGRRLAGNIYARSALAQGAFLSKVFHTFLVQSGSDAVRGKVIQRLQSLMNSLVFGKYYEMTIAQAQQPHRDGGIAHVNVGEKLRASWASLVTQLADGSTNAPWKNIWMAALRSVYGPLADSRIFYSTCTFQLLRKPAPIGTHSQPSAVCKLALAAWGDLPRKLPVFYALPENEQGKGPPPDAKPLLYTGINCRRVPKGAEVGQEHIWFNNCLGHQSSTVPVPAPQAHRAFQLSDERAEREAIQWAHAGLVTLSDVMAGTTFMGPSAFRQRYPQLDSSLCLALRSALPPTWSRALQDGSAATWGAKRAQHDVLAPHVTQHAVPYPPTLRCVRQAGSVHEA